MDIFYPLQWLADEISFEVLYLLPNSYTGNAVNFFIFDSLKIGIMLLTINYIMAIARYYFPLEKIRDVLASRNWYGADYLVAAIFGVITPFCSCSSIPLFIGFLSSGIPLGVTFAFLITSPLVNEASLALFPALFGMRITFLYNLIGVMIGVFGGLIIQKLHLEKFLDPSISKVKAAKNGEIGKEGIKPPLRTLFSYWWVDGWSITKKIFPYALIGIGIGAVIHGFVPTGFFEKYLSEKSIWAVPIATLLGVPLYANSVSVIPIMEALVGKGVPLGTALAFITATVTLSIPEALILKKVLRWQLLATFFGITIVGIMFIGYFFNAIR